MESDGGREAIRSATAEEEAVKRNTDCVYFLASPLTCKKGSECEYRHSEGARVNPRDCWYWLNGNCLNPKCSFRHPPLDPPFATPNPGPVPPSQTAASSQTQASRAPNNTDKQSVACYYFQWGQCLKGEWCPFMHGPISSVSQQVSKASMSPAGPPQLNNKASQQNITVQQNVSELNLDKSKVIVKNPVELSSVTEKLVTKAENLLHHETSENKRLPPYSLNYKPPAPVRNISSINSSNSQSQPWGYQVQHTDEQPENIRDTDEFLREHSPGFDVLVEHHNKDPDYYHTEDNFRRVSAHGEQNVEPEDDYDYHHSDYEPMARIERDSYVGIGKFDKYDLPHGRYGLDSKTIDRTLDKPSSLKRRSLDRGKRSDMDGSDLRHRLKQRRVNGSQSTSNHDGERARRGEQYVEERHYGQHRRDERQIPPEKPLSTRLQGRIALPGRAIDVASNLLHEKERDRRPRGRLSPIRRINYQGTRDPERIRQQPGDDISEDDRMLRKKSTRRGGMDSLDFAGPKSLAELKGTRINENSNVQQIKGASSDTKLKNVKSGKVEGLQDPQISLSFEGPKPLSVILKRKRELADADNELSSGQYDNSSGGESVINEYMPAAVSSLESVPPPEAGNEGNNAIGSHEQDAEDGELPYDGKFPIKADAIEADDCTNSESAEEEELENYDQRDGDFDYESGEYKVEDAENTFHVEEDNMDDDDEDDDDFATKVSVMLS
ncbi:zinc finger CCCH domain-containing protein 32 [Canna indica]|uniref:Zinc finger CCCH domain-containing protein 32 n=1 Tax=Canna indica TaxID=4628 RepID=A0AAQ3L4A3_9LILI|nr:zinc finger CCCH domain-containing protein 32 [Canna indica]